LGFITTQILPKLSAHVTTFIDWIGIGRTPVRPELQFHGKKASSSWQKGITASTGVATPLRYCISTTPFTSHKYSTIICNLFL
jgi:hypothetical protein